ncbi:vesicular glutamate transporter 1-like isoform X2 [Phymastichus coffea]|uniref:vesicular glutamate transporter 1-like isoform X2 n=1 Tax=Phymastichus coffea TaxID=108790 RepID=UPI00273B0A43|nr:vesicular glutamate transporter 1-like isoform X2 [Phymastichus coffea]
MFVQRWIPVRAIICVMMFTACWTSYMCRLQMPILAVPMIREKAGEAGSANACQNSNGDGGAAGSNGDVRRIWQSTDVLMHDIVDEQWSRRLRRQDDADDHAHEKRTMTEWFTGNPFDWSPSLRGQLLAAYAYGNVPGNLIGGVLAIKFGPRQTILWTSVLAAVVSLVSPLLANVHWGFLMASRVIVGLTGGITFPACHTLVAKWAPPDEKSRFVWSLLGGTFGTIFTYPMIAALAEKINWESGWYVPSLLLLFWCFFWWLLAYDSPNEHPGITDEEKNYIISSQAGTVRAERPTLKETPLGAIFTSIPFISLIICHFGNLFLLFFYQNSMMLYLTKALGFQLTKGGLLASLPWFARMLFGFFFSWGGDIVKRKQIVSLTAFRKSAMIFSHLLPGVCLIIVGYVGCSFVLANTFLFLALGFNGAASISNLSNNQDLSPNFAGFLYGIMNTVGTTTGMIIPPMVEAIAGKHNNAIEQWQIVFWIGASVCIVSMIIYILGGSAQIQPWNEGKKPRA